MPRALAALAAALAALVAGSSAGATAASPLPSDLTVALSTQRAGAHDVAVTLGFRTLLTCGRPSGTIVVGVPQAARLPQAIPAALVRVNGRPAGSVSVAGRTLTIMPSVGGIICQSISEGAATVTIAAAAGYANPARAGAYSFSVVHAGTRHAAAVAIARPAAAPTGGLFGTVLRGPTKPVCESGMMCNEPAAGVLLTFLRGGVTVATTATSSTGSYRVLLAPGTYSLRASPASPVGGLKPVTATVGRTLVHRDLFIDTGIR